MPDLRRDGIGRGEAGAAAPLGDTIRLPNARCRSTRSRCGRLGESGPAPYRKPHPIPARPLTLDPRLARIPRLPRIAAPSINAGLEFRVAHESPRARSTRSSNSESRATRISGCAWIDTRLSGCACIDGRAAARAACCAGPRVRSTAGSKSAPPTNRRALDQREARIPSRPRRGKPAARGSTLNRRAARGTTPRPAGATA